jgi:V8-like Glu-specific endopeptidase
MPRAARRHRPSRLRSITRILALAACIAVALGVDLGGAAADGAAASTSAVVASARSGPVADDTGRSSSDREAADAEAYWTPARLRAADREDATAAEAGPAAESDVVRSVAGRIRPEKWIGIVSFVRGGRDVICSAAAVGSDSGLLIATAGHCLYSGGQWASHVAFIPGWDGSVAPLGIWRTSVYQVPSDWRLHEDPSHDAAFIRAVPRKSLDRDLSLARQTGAPYGDFGLAEPGLHYVAFGYRAPLTLDPQPLSSCVGPGYRMAGTRQLVLVGCSASAGMSGGPVYHLSTRGPAGTQVGVISRDISSREGSGQAFVPWGAEEDAVAKAVDGYAP